MPRAKKDPGTGEDVSRYIEGARAGNLKDLERLLQGCIPYLRKIVTIHCPTERPLHGKLDVEQETLLRAIRSFADFRGSTANEVRRWLRRILINFLSDESQRAREWLEPITEDNNLLDEKTPLALALQTEKSRIIQQALANLEEDQQRVLELRNEAKLSWNGVAEELKRSPEAARKLYRRATVKLGKLVQRVGFVEESWKRLKGS